MPRGDLAAQRHGSHAMYVYARCRCAQCVEFTKTYNRLRGRQKGAQPNPLLDGAPLAPYIRRRAGEFAGAQGYGLNEFCRRLSYEYGAKWTTIQRQFLWALAGRRLTVATADRLCMYLKVQPERIWGEGWATERGEV